MIKLTEDIYVKKDLIEAAEIILLNPESFPGVPQNYREDRIGYYVLVHLKQNNQHPGMGGMAARNYLFNPQAGVSKIEMGKVFIGPFDNYEKAKEELTRIFQTFEKT